MEEQESSAANNLNVMRKRPKVYYRLCIVYIRILDFFYIQTAYNSRYI